MIVEREIQEAHCHCPSCSSALPEGRALPGQSRTRPLARCLLCPTGLSSALPSSLSDVLWHCALLHSDDALLSMCARPGEVVRDCQSLRAVFSELLQILAMWTSNVFKDSGRKDLLKRLYLSSPSSLIAWTKGGAKSDLCNIYILLDFFF